MSIDVLHLLPSLSLFGGTPRKIHDLIQNSSRQHGIYCWARWEDAELAGSFDAIFQTDGIPVFQGDYGRNLIKHAREIVRIVDDQGVRVVHGYFETGLLLAAVAKLMRRHVKTAVSFVGFPAHGGFTKNLLQNLLSTRIDHVVYVSRFTQQAFQSSYPRLKSRPSQIIYNGVKERHVGLLPQYSRVTCQVATVSGLIGWKNIGLLLDVLNILQLESAGGARLSVIGDGPMRSELEQKARLLGVTQQVEFCGYQEDVGSLLSACQIYLHPALTEGFGIAVVEAMLMGKPVIVADAGALPELVEHEVSGLVVNPTNPKAWAKAIQRLSKDPGLARRLGLAGRERAERYFSIDRFVEEHEQLYKRLLEAV